jgi:hypothetical protein
MRVSFLAVVVPLVIVPLASAQDNTEKVPLVKPVRIWEGRFDRDMPADGPLSVHVLADARGFEVPWAILRGKEKVPAIDFKEHFVVLVIYPGGQYVLEGLSVDRRGNARVKGSGVERPVAMPTGRWYVLAVLPRGKVKTVEGREIPGPK